MLQVVLMRCVVGDLLCTELNSRDTFEGVRKGIDEDDLVALQLGKARAQELSIVQQKYKDKLKQRLIEVTRWFHCCYFQRHCMAFCHYILWPACCT
jgi:hypothetical protein